MGLLDRMKHAQEQASEAMSNAGGVKGMMGNVGSMIPTAGDASYAQGAMGVYLQGTQVDSFTTAANQFVPRTYPSAVSGGTLVLRLVGMGPTSPFAVINGLEAVQSVAWVDRACG